MQINSLEALVDLLALGDPRRNADKAQHVYLMHMIRNKQDNKDSAYNTVFHVRKVLKIQSCFSILKLYALCTQLSHPIVNKLNIYFNVLSILDNECIYFNNLL